MVNMESEGTRSLAARQTTTLEIPTHNYTHTHTHEKRQIVFVESVLMGYLVVM